MTYLLPAPRLTDSVYAMDAVDFLRCLPDASVDAVITDPPYPREYLPLYGMLAEQAARILKPGGSLLVMCGSLYLPELFALMTPHIRYHWTIGYHLPGGQNARLWQQKVIQFWKPILWFVKGKYNGYWIGDVVRSAANDNDKRFHHWGQSESGMIELVRRVTRPGDFVIDPFSGGGTTLVVAKQLGRHFAGCDIDPSHVATCLRRLAEPRTMPLFDAHAPAAAVQERLPL